MTAPEQDTIIVKAPPGSKAAWVRASQSESMKLNDWVVRAIEIAYPGLAPNRGPGPLTQKQFDIITTMIQMEADPRREAARMMLVDGAEISDALAVTGVSREDAKRAAHLVTYNFNLALSAVRHP